MKVLIVTNMYPNSPTQSRDFPVCLRTGRSVGVGNRSFASENPNFGIFVQKQVESLKGEHLEVDVMFINGRKSSFNYLIGVFRLLNMVLKNKHDCGQAEYDLIHAHYGFSGIVARFQCKIPVVVSFHGSDINLPLQCFLSRILARCVDKSIVVSSQLKKRLKSKNVEVIPCGIDLSLIVPMQIESAKKELGLELSTDYLLFPADPKDKAKGYALFAQVVNLLQNKGLKVKELILKNVLYNKVPFYYNSASVMIFTSEREGSPMVIKEALACNLPIVSVKVGDVPERLKGIDGCFVVERNAEAIANKVEQVLQKGRLKNGREAVKELSLENVAKKIITVYNSIIVKCKSQGKR